jgi:hypothetical protein
VGPEGRLSGWLKVARLARPSWREAAVAELQGLARPVLARGRFYWASLRVARWVANRCVRVLLCVAPRCSPSVSLLVTLHSCWSVEVPALHGMQEVSGSSPLSSTPGQRPFSRSRERAFFILRGTLRGKIVSAACGCTICGMCGSAARSCSAADIRS